MPLPKKLNPNAQSFTPTSAAAEKKSSRSLSTAAQPFNLPATAAQPFNLRRQPHHSEQKVEPHVFGFGAKIEEDKQKAELKLKNEEEELKRKNDEEELKRKNDVAELKRKSDEEEELKRKNEQERKKVEDDEKQKNFFEEQKQKKLPEVQRQTEAKQLADKQPQNDEDAKRKDKEREQKPEAKDRKYNRDELMKLGSTQNPMPPKLADFFKANPYLSKNSKSVPPKQVFHGGFQGGAPRGNFREQTGAQRRRGVPPAAPLVVTENGYKRKAEVPPDERLIRDVNSLLNKLTPEKFDSLFEQFVKLRVDENESKLRDAANAVFEKALSEPDFSPIYARFTSEVTEKVSKQFRKMLLQTLENEFSKTSDPNAIDSDSKLSAQEKEAQTIKTRRRRFGMVRYIGELYGTGIITSGIISACFTKLLVTTDSEKYAAIDESDIEELCLLISTVGKKLSAKNGDSLDQTLATLDQLVKEQKISQSRVRFLIHDTLDLKQNDWKERIQKVQQTTLMEVHQQEAERKQMKDNKRKDYEEKTVSKGRNSGRSSNAPTPRGSGTASKATDGWNDSKSKSGTQRSGHKTVVHETQDVRKVAAKNPVEKTKNLFNQLSNEDEVEEASVVVQSKGPSTVRPIDRDSLVAKITDFLDEYLEASDIEEAKRCASQLGAPDYNHNIVFLGMMKSFEKKRAAHDRMRDLFSVLITCGILKSKHVEDGFNELLSDALDLLPDFPLLIEWVGEFFACFCCLQAIPLSYLTSESTLKLTKETKNKKTDLREKFALVVFSNIRQAKGEEELVRLFNEAELNLSVINMSATTLNEKVNEFMAKYKV